MKPKHSKDRKGRTARTSTLRIDFHGHTNYSRDCLISIDALRKAALKKGVIPCITDHNTIQGALAYKKKFGPDSCIVGEEIKTTKGEIIGLYMTKEVPPFLTPEETMKRLHAQKAIIAIPHPFDRMRTSRLQTDILRLSKKYKVHFIEVFNSRTLFEEDNEKALDFARKNNFLMSVGSDWHTTYELGRSVAVVEYFDVTKKEEMLQAFSKKHSFSKRKSTILVHAVTKGLKILGRKGIGEKK